MKYNKGMFLNRTKKLLKFSVLFAFLGVILLGSLCTGMFHAKDMHLIEAGDAYSFVPPAESCCGATYLERANLWESISLSSFNSIRDLISLLGLISLAFFCHTKIWDSKIVIQRILSKVRWLTRLAPRLQLSTPLKLAFAAGILHPKTY